MKNLWPLVLLGVAFFFWNKSCREPLQQARSQRGETHASDSVATSGARQWEQQPKQIVELGNAAPQPGGLSSKSILDSARSGLQQPRN